MRVARKHGRFSSFVVLAILCWRKTFGYVVVIDDREENPNFPGMCVSPHWGRILPAGASYPVSRWETDGIPPCSDLSEGFHAQVLHPCEQVSCVKVPRPDGFGGRFVLQITGCENSLLNVHHDRACNVYLPDQRLPFPLCCPQRSCPTPFDVFTPPQISPLFQLLRAESVPADSAMPALPSSKNESADYSKAQHLPPNPVSDYNEQFRRLVYNGDSSAVKYGGDTAAETPYSPFPFAPILLPTTNERGKEFGKDKIIFVTKEDHEQPTTVTLSEDEEDRPPGLILANGDINWNCPCLGGMATGPCGVEFRDAFSCFHFSEAEPKGSDCVEKFSEMQQCMTKYPALYGKLSESEEDDEVFGIQEDDEEKAAAGEVVETIRGSSTEDSAAK